MNDQPAIDRLVTDWLRADAPQLAPQAVLSAALDRVAVVGQERPLGGRRFDAWIGRSPRLHWAIVLVLLALLVLGTIAGAGASLRTPAVPRQGAANGWIAVSANPGYVGSGEAGDIYLLREGVAARRIIGSAGDGIAQACPMFSPDGRMLAYGEGRQALQAGDNPLRGRTSVADRAVVVVGLDDQGNATSPIVRVAPPAAAGVMACPVWSHGGESLAFHMEDELWIADVPSGNTTMLQVARASRGEEGFAWSRDGSRIAVAEPGRIRVVSVRDGTKSFIQADGGTPALIGWTIGDQEIVILATDDPGDGRELHVVDVKSLADRRLMPSLDGPRTTFDPGFGALVSVTPNLVAAALAPDGARLALAFREFRCASDGCTGGPEQLLTMHLDGTDVVDVPVPPVVTGLQWSPDGERLLLGSIGDVVSIPVAPGSPVIVHSRGELNLEWSGSEITWQPVFR